MTLGPIIFAAPGVAPPTCNSVKAEMGVLILEWPWSSM